MMERYSPQMILPEVGRDGQEKLSRTSILVVGAGGLGCPTLSYLAAAGIGRIVIVDHDRVTLSNLHRQILYETQDVGRLKVEAAVEKLERQNPDIIFEPIAERVTPVNAQLLVAMADVIIDAADSLAVTYMLSDATKFAGKPLVSASVAGLKGYVGAFCGSAPSYRAVFSDMPQRLENCATAGVLGTAVAVVGSMQAHMVLQLALGIEPKPLGRIISVDFRTMRFGGFSFTGVAEPDDCLAFIDPTQFEKDDFVVDLRGVEEAQQLVTAEANRIGMDDIDRLAEAATTGHRVVLCCRSGIRAWRVGRKLQAQGLSNIALSALGA